MSPLPFLGPIGAVRMGIVDGNLVVNPTLQEIEESDLDLIVVGTKDGLTMVEAGAKQVHEDKLLEALEIAHREIVKLCDAQLELRVEEGQDEVARPGRHRAARGRRTATRSGSASSSRASARRLRSSRRSSRRKSALRRSTPNEEKVFGELQVRMSLAQILEKQRSVAVETVVREKFENDLQGLTDAEQDSKELKSAKRSLALRAHHRERRAAVPGRPGHRRRRARPSRTR